MSIVYDTIYFKRGPEATMPTTANNGEPLWTTDTHRMFVGYGNGIKEIAGAEDLGYVTPEMFGIVDGVNDEVQIQLAIDALPVTGGIVQFGPKTYIAEGLTIPSLVHFRGSGENVTIIKAPTNSTVELLKSSAWNDLDGSIAPESLGGDYSFSISDMTIDGNRDNVAAALDTVSLFGYGYKLHNLVIKNSTKAGLITKWSASPNSPAVDLDFCETALSNIKVHDCDLAGILWQGPHDSTWDNVISYRNWPTGGTSTYNVRVYGEANKTTGGPLYMSNCHFWGGDSGYAISIESRVMAVNCVAEGAQLAQVRIEIGNTSWIGGEIFSSEAEQTTRGINAIGIQIVGSITGLDIVTQTRGCLGGSIDFGSASASKFILNNHQTTGIPRTGTYPVDGTIIFNTNNPLYNINRFSGPLYIRNPAGNLATVTAYGLRTNITTTGGSQTIATPIGYRYLNVISGSAASITNFTGASDGQELIIQFADANTTIVSGTRITLAGNVNFVGQAGSILHLIYHYSESPAADTWYEMDRYTGDIPVSLIATQALTNKTLTTPIIDTLDVFADNTAAAALAAGTVYRTSTGVLMVKY